MWEVGGMQVHGIGRRRLMYNEVGEVLSKYKKYYF